MKTTLQQLKAIDENLIIEGNMVYLQDKAEFINYKFGYFEDNVNEDNACEFYFDNMDRFDSDNGGIIHSEHFEGVVDENLNNWEEMMRKSNNTDKKLVVVWNVATTLMPVVVMFPTDVIEEGVEYEVEYKVDNEVGEWEDIEYSDDNWFVV